MRKSVLTGLGLAALRCCPAGRGAQTSNAWLHIRVEEAQKASKVHVNLPMSVVEVALKATPGIIEEHGKLNLGEHHGMKLADFRRMWKQLAAVGDAEFVTVESEDENVRVQRKGDVVMVYVDNKHGGHKTATPRPLQRPRSRRPRPRRRRRRPPTAPRRSGSRCRSASWTRCSRARATR